MIKINGSKIGITQLGYEKGDSLVKVDKGKLKYQRILFTSEGSSKFAVIPAVAEDVEVPSGIRKAFSEAWVLEKLDTKAKKEKYDGLEKDVMLKWMKALYPAHLDTAELLCRACGYGNIMTEFYKSYGTEMIRDFYRLIDSITDGYGKGSGRCEKKYAAQYISRKYSVYELLQDIMKSGKVKIYTDPELLGEYRRITRKKIVEGSMVPDLWCPVVGLVGNRERANLSLSYMTKITVDVPENPYGAEPGPRNLECVRSFCIIKDGIVWSKRLGIKTTDKTLVRKLRGSGAIEMDLVMSDEYLLNLENLPVISIPQTRNITSWQLAGAEAAIEYARIGGAWARRMDYMERKSLPKCPEKMEFEPKDPAETYLNSLGIYGNKYVPVSKTAAVERKYTVYELKGYVGGIPKDPVSSVIKAINGTGVGIVKDVVDKLALDHAKSGRTYKEEVEYWEEELGKRIKNLRDLKFRFIMGKTLKFSDDRRTKVENVVVPIPIVGLSKVRVHWKVEKSEVDL